MSEAATKEAEADVGGIAADRIRLEQVFVNLLQNALKFSRRGGAVTARVAPGPAAP